MTIKQQFKSPITKTEFLTLERNEPGVFHHYFCSQCGRSARTNTPAIDDGGNIWCFQCVYRSPVMMQGVNQRTLEVDPKDPYTYFTKNGAVVHVRGKIDHAWLRDGTQVVPIREEEKFLSPEVFLDLIIAARDAGKYRCSDCGGTFEGKPAGYPLFAGINCIGCWEKHQAKVEKEREHPGISVGCAANHEACAAARRSI
jgi:DNA-directed RNA polymerase subunit RPC12/RpoP